jgi:hypothetical protein
LKRTHDSTTANNPVQGTPTTPHRSTKPRLAPCHSKHHHTTTYRSYDRQGQQISAHYAAKADEPQSADLLISTLGASSSYYDIVPRGCQTVSCLRIVPQAAICRATTAAQSLRNTKSGRLGYIIIKVRGPVEAVTGDTPRSTRMDLVP